MTLVVKWDYFFFTDVLVFRDILFLFPDTHNCNYKRRIVRIVTFQDDIELKGSFEVNYKELSTDHSRYFLSLQQTFKEITLSGF